MLRLISNLGVYICDHVGRRRLTMVERASVRQFAKLMADPDINRIVREKPVDYMGWTDVGFGVNRIHPMNTTGVAPTLGRAEREGG